MKFLIDAQLPPLMAEVLRHRGFEAVHVFEEQLGASDGAIWRFAIEGGWVIVTKDEDFVDRFGLPGPAPQLVWVRWGNLRNRPLLDNVRTTWSAVVAKLADGEAMVELR